MKFIKLLSYANDTTTSSPLYLILMSDVKDRTDSEILSCKTASTYISYANVFIENTEENIESNSKYKIALDKLLDANHVKGKTASTVVQNETFLTDVQNQRFLANEAVPPLLDTIEDARCMFYGCKNLETVNINLPKVEDTSYMFYGCTNLKTVNINVPKVKYVNSMFCNCTNLKTINIDISNVEYAIAMFRGCTSLEKFNENVEDETSSTNVSLLVKAIHTTSMFENCTNLKTIDIGAPNAIGANSMFYGCKNLETVNIDISNAEDTSDMFYGCTSLDVKSKILIALQEL